MISTYPPRRCGIGTFCRDLSNALSNFTSEVGYIRIAAIDNSNEPYNIPVDLVIDQYKPSSWKSVTNEILERAESSKIPTLMVLQHEYGLDPSDTGEDCMGFNYVNMAKAFQAHNHTTVVYLHTILEEPDDHQKKIIQQLSEHCDGLIVTTESATDILEANYDIDSSKLKHIDHGIRMQNPSQFDRYRIKQEFGLDDHLLVTTLGLLSPGKGIQYGIRGYGRFLNESMTPGQRKRIVYLIAGQCHPEFVKADGGSYYRQYMDELNDALKSNNLSHCTVKELSKDIDYDSYDVIFYESFLDDTTLMKLYGATNAMLLPYLNMQQISSGILADTLGAGRVAIATKCMYALELINSNKKCPKGVVVGRHTRGILIDPGEESVDQIAQALDLIVFDKKKRLRIESQAHQRGYQMRWKNSAWALLQFAEYIREEKEIVTGRGIVLNREKRSVFQRFGPNTYIEP